MECSATFTKKSGRRAAFTLIEFMVGMTIGSAVLLVMLQLTFYTGRSFAALYNYIELDRYSRNALDQMVYKIRQADAMTSFSANQMSFSYNTTNNLVYTYSSGAKTLTE